MTKEEAIEILDNGRYFVPVESWHYEYNEAIDMAISALHVEQKYVADLVEEAVNKLLDSGDWRVAISNKHKSADRPTIVRCKDCVHFTGLNESKTWGRCNAHGRTAQDIDYCSWGERKGGAE